MNSTKSAAVWRRDALECFPCPGVIILCDLATWMAWSQEDDDRIHNFVWTNKDGRMNRFASRGTKFKTGTRGSDNHSQKDCWNALRRRTPQPQRTKWQRSHSVLKRWLLRVSTSKRFSGKCGWCTHPGCLSAPTTETESFASLWHCGKRVSNSVQANLYHTAWTKRHACLCF